MNLKSLRKKEDNCENARIKHEGLLQEWCNAMMTELGMEPDEAERFSICPSTGPEYTLFRDGEWILDAISTDIVMSYSKDELLTIEKDQ